LPGAAALPKPVGHEHALHADAPPDTPLAARERLSMATGWVYIVGAGPGDPELLTLKALRLIRAADVIVFDRLVSLPILKLIPPGTTQVFAGKMARNHHMPQAEINALLVALAESGRTVVRLKGGDPFLFGRGGEEAEHLAARGIPYEIVPGITSASGCSAYAGIPLTHRGLSHSVRIVTGHTRDDAPLDLDWAALADSHSTLVVYMGRITVDQISRRLIEHGLNAATPAAALVDGTRPEQQTILTTVGALPAAVAALDKAAPTLIIIGRVVDLSATLAWFRPAAATDSDADENATPAAEERA
jgi:uroporphyrin-III C-methyltransferase